MQQQPPPPHQHSVNPTGTMFDDDEIDVRKLLAKMWQFRKIILGGTLIIVVLAIAMNEYRARYQSQGFFRVSGVNPVNYKRYQSAIMNPERFRAYASEAGIADERSITYLSGLFASKPDEFSKVAALVYSVTPKDAKEYMLNADKDRDNGAFLGLQLNVQSTDRNQAKNLNYLIANYFVDSIMFTEMSDWVDSKTWEREAQSFSLKNKVIKTTREISEAELKLVALKLMLKRNPDASRMEVRQVLTLEKGGERFLSPVAQIVATETQILEAKLELSTLLRKQKQLDIAHEYFKRASTLTSKTSSGKILFEKLAVAKTDIFKNADASDEVIAEVSNDIAVELETRRKTYFQDFRFISGPTLPEKKEKIRVPLVIAGSAALGFFFMSILCLFISWWLQNGKLITANNNDLVDTE